MAESACSGWRLEWSDVRFVLELGTALLILPFVPFMKDKRP